MAYVFYRQHPERYLAEKTRLLTTGRGDTYMVTMNELMWHCFDHYTTEPGFTYTADQFVEWALAKDFVDPKIEDFSQRFAAVLLYLDKRDYESNPFDKSNTHKIN